MYIWFLSLFMKMAIEIPSPWRKHQYLHQFYSRFSNLQSNVHRRVLRFTDVFSNILISRCFAFFYRFSYLWAYAYCLCQNHAAKLQNWSSSKANENTQETRVCFIGWSPRYRHYIVSSMSKDRYCWSCDEITELA